MSAPRVSSAPTSPDAASGRSSDGQAIDAPRWGVPEPIATQGSMNAATLAGSAERHLATAHVQVGLKKRTVAGGLVSGASQTGQFVLTLAYYAILARLLRPRDFGLIAMATTVAGFLRVFRDAGLSTATIQREQITHAQVSNLFWINGAVSGLATLVMVGSAPFVASFFHEPQLLRLSIGLSFGFLFEGLAVQHVALLNRQMRFTVIATLELACTALGFLVGVAMALVGWDYWSLVGATLSTGAFRLVAIWNVSGWKPSAPAARSGTRPLVRFGTDLTVVGVIYSLSRGSDALLIGRFLGTEAVGLYSRATALLMRPLERFIAPIYSVTVPALSRLQSEPERYRAAFLWVFEALAVGGFVFSGLFLPLAVPLVRVILGEAWTPVAPIFAALSTVALSLPPSTAVSWLCASQGRGKDLLVTAVLEAAAMVGSFAIGLSFGPTGVAVAYSVSFLVLRIPITFYIAGRKGPVSTGDLWLAWFRHSAVLAAVLGATWLAYASAPGLGPFAQLVYCVPAGALAGAGAMMAVASTRRMASATIRAIIHSLR
jgi:O-antigen/teichoic acid export membrane protein